MYAVGHLGFSWASSFTGIYAYHLYFTYDALCPNYYNYHRANGFQLRCLQE
ncbi:MAG: hypothetical protein K2K83_03305 [Rikenella sp.]|nr:hypothetical protein [Rikenella sp.]